MIAAGRTHKKGFILLEVMVAVTILAIGIVAVMNIFSTTINVNSKLQRRTLAVQLSEFKLWQWKDDIIRTGNVETGESTGRFGSLFSGVFGHSDENYSDFVWSMTVVRVDHESIPEKFTDILVQDERYYTEIPSALYEMVLSIYWRNTDEANQLHSFRTRWRPPKVKHWSGYDRY
jgi:prepilin-type N-terminal cleavage/methylation domain-containing protein